MRLPKPGWVPVSAGQHAVRGHEWRTSPRVMSSRAIENARGRALLPPAGGHQDGVRRPGRADACLVGRICPVHALPVHSCPAQEPRPPYHHPRKLRRQSPSTARADSPSPSTTSGHRNPPRTRQRADPSVVRRAAPARPHDRPHRPARGRRLVAAGRRRRAGGGSVPTSGPGSPRGRTDGVGGFRLRAGHRERARHPAARFPSPPARTAWRRMRKHSCRPSGRRESAGTTPFETAPPSYATCAWPIRQGSRRNTKAVPRVCSYSTSRSIRTTFPEHLTTAGRPGA